MDQERIQTIQIRLARVEDIPAIIDLQSLCLRVLNSREYTQRQVESLVVGQARCRKDLFHDEIVFVAVSEGDRQIVGFASLQIETPHVGSMFVHPSMTRKGLGSQLLGAVETAGQEKGYPELSVLSSLMAVAFYEKNGFKRVGNSGFYSESGVWIPCVLLRKKLFPLAAPVSPAQTFRALPYSDPSSSSFRELLVMVIVLGFFLLLLISVV